MNEETWKDVVGFEGKYFVSTTGKIKNAKGKILKGMTSRMQQYAKYALPKGDGTYAYLMEHRIVATAFLPNKNNYPVVHHKDGNRANNCVSNLEWCTHRHNTQEMVKAGKHYQFSKGLTNPSAKFNDLQINGIRKLKSLGWSLTEISDLMNCSRSYISELVNNKKRANS
jgi:hypothetical protein